MFSYIKMVITSLAVFMYFAVCQTSTSAQSSDQIWVTKAYSATGLAPNNGPAVAMATRGNRVAIGYPQIATVVIFEKDEFGRYLQIDKIVNPDNLSKCYFGQSLCFAGEDLLIGSYNLRSDMVADGADVIATVADANPIYQNYRTYVYRPTSGNTYGYLQTIDGVGTHIASNGVYVAVARITDTSSEGVLILSKNLTGLWVTERNLNWRVDNYYIISNISFIGDRLIVVVSGRTRHYLDDPFRIIERYYPLGSKGLGLTNYRWPLDGMKSAWIPGDNISSINDPGIFVFGKSSISGWIMLRHDSLASYSIFDGKSASHGFASLIRTIGNEVYASDALGGGNETVAGSGSIHSAIITAPTDGIPFAESFTPPDKIFFDQPIDEVRYVGSGSNIVKWNYRKEGHPDSNPGMSFGYAFDVNDAFLVAGAPKRGAYYSFISAVDTNPPSGAIYVYDRNTRNFLLWVNGGPLSARRFGSTVSYHDNSFLIGSESLNGTFHSLSLVSPLTISLSQTSISAGQKTTATIQVTSAAPKGGLKCMVNATATLSGVPATIVIPEGKLQVSFPVSTTSVVDSVASLTVIANGFTDGKASIQIVSPRAIVNAAVSKSTLGPGETTELSVTVDKPAPTGGLSLPIAKSADILTGESILVIPKGAVTGTVTLTAVAVPTATTASLSITTGSDTKAVGVTVNPPTIKSITISPTSVPGGQVSTGTLTLSYNAPVGGMPVKIASDNASALVPASVTVPAGASSTTFPITTKPVTALTVTNVSATVNGVTLSATLSIRPPAALSSIVIVPTTVIGGTVNATGTITLSDVAPAGGSPVTLASSKPTAAAVPATVVVPEGSTSTTFTITSKVVTVSTPVIVTGKYLTVTKTATVTVDPPGRSVPLASLQSKPSTTIGGETVQLTLTLRNPAPPEGVTVIVQVSDAKLATAPSTVFIPAGTSQSTFAVRTQQVSNSQGLRITVRSGMGAVSSDIALTPQPRVTKFSIASKEVSSYQAVIATVELASPAPSNGTWVSIKSTNKSIEPVQDFLVPSGTKSTSVTIRAGKVTRKTVVNLTAATSGGSKTLSISVLP